MHADTFADWRVPLAQYAWKYWGHHIRESGFGFVTAEVSAKILSHFGAAVPMAHGD